MPRIPDEEIERIKRETSIVALVERSGVELRRHGGSGDLAGLCPFHEEETPSLIVTESKALWHCFGCGKGGDVIQWVMERRGVSFREAAERLLEGDGAAVVVGEQLAARASEAEDAAALVGIVMELYHARATVRPDVAGYLHERGIERAREWIERYRLGQSDRTLGYGLPRKLRERLQAVGLIRESGHELFSGSLVVPIADQAGAVVEVYGRKLGSRLRKGTPLHLFLPGPHRGVWNAEAVARYREVILCEGFFDALTFVDRGFENVTWVYGVEGLTADHLELFRRAGTERVLLGYDGDAAGDRGAERHSERLCAEGIEVFRLPVPRGHDINSFARSVADAREALADLVRRAEWTGRGVRPVVVVDVPAAIVEDEDGPEAAPTLAAPIVAADPAPEPIASPVPATPAMPSIALDVELVGEDVWLRLGDRAYRVRGLGQNTVYGQMKVSLLLVFGEALHADTLDLGVDRNRVAFANRSAEETGLKAAVVKHDLARVLYALEGLQEERLRAAETPAPVVPAMTDGEREAALELLTDPALLSRILTDFERCGVVGEETNKLVCYLAAVSRKLDDPLAVLIQSSSAAGKTSLMEAVLAMVPGEDRVKYSAMTGQSLFYMSEQDLKHKVLALVEEEGAERASYALKLLQSEGELAIASTGKDPQTGRLVTHEYRVEGPVALVLTTTAVDVDEELENRCIVLTVDEDREQTRAIHRQQRERRTLEGLLAKRARDRIVALHRNAQRLLRPVAVLNPFARRLTFLDDKTRTRRDHEKYLTLIDTIAFVHQYQREVKTAADTGGPVHYVEVTLSDIEAANRLAHEVLGRSLDELAPQTRRLLVDIERMVAGSCERLELVRRDYRFTQRGVREATGWSATQIKVHLERLVDLEYVLVHRGGRGQQFVYELVYDGDGTDGRPHLAGLLDVDALRAEGYDAQWSGQNGGWSGENGEWSGGGRGVVGPWSGGGPSPQTQVNANGTSEIAGDNAAALEITSMESTPKQVSYVLDRRSRGGA